MDVDVFQIFDYIKKESDNNSEFCTNINNLLIDTHNSKFEIQLDALWHDYCNRNDLCEDCGCRLKFRESKEPTEEYFGFPTNQTIFESYCPSCE